MTDNDKTTSRQILCPGVVLEKSQETIGKQNLYILKVEVQVFQEADFCVDFTGSTKIKIEGNPGLVCKVKVMPFSKITVVKLILEKGWSLKTKFQCSMDLPSIDLQKQKLIPMVQAIDKELEKSGGLENYDLHAIDENHILEYLKKVEGSFIDHDFKPKSDSVSPDPAFCVVNLRCIPHWRKAKYLLLTTDECKKTSSLPSVIANGIKPSDVIQGQITNSWLLSAFSALADFPNLIKRVIITKEPNEYGLYKIKLWHTSKWINIVVDDYIPCLPFGNPLFTQNNSKEFWPMLIEKAFAKRYGSYSKLVTGTPKSAFIDLTSCPTFIFNLKEQQVKDWLEKNELYKMLQSWKKASYAIVLSSNTTKLGLDIGISLDHSFTLLSIHRKEQIMILRNPKPNSNFSGKYKEDSENWTTELKSAINPVFNMEYQYLSFDEFLTYFKSITVCKINRWNELSVKGKFVRSIDTTDGKTEVFSSRWYYKVTLDKPTKLIIGIHQTDENMTGVKETSPYIDIGLGVLNIFKDVYQYITFENPSYERDVYLELKLEPGIYCIIPKSSGLNLQDAIDLSAFTDDFDSDNMRAVMKDTFEKLDMEDKGYLTFEEIKQFYSYFYKTITEEEIIALFTEKKPEIFDSDYESKTTFKFFTLVYKSIYDSYSVDDKAIFLEKIGYTKDLQSIRNRLFGITIHSDQPVELSTDDALKNGIDETMIKLLLKNEGIDIYTGEKIVLTEKQVIPCQYYNR